MSDKSNGQKALDSLTEVGKEITINIEIADQEKAQRLMGTMYRKNIEEFGVSVTSWGFWDTSKASQLRLEMIRSENDRHNIAISDIYSMTDREILKLSQ